jgi:hypothetical protein
VALSNHARVRAKVEATVVQIAGWSSSSGWAGDAPGGVDSLARGLFAILATDLAELTGREMCSPQNRLIYGASGG